MSQYEPDKIIDARHNAQREPVTVSKQGRPVAVMMSIHDYEEMKLEHLRAHLAVGEEQIARGE